MQATNSDEFVLPKVSRLTPEQISTLDVSAALRMLGEITNLNHQLTDLVISSNEEMQISKMKLDAAKNVLKLLKSNASILQSIVRHA